MKRIEPFPNQLLETDTLDDIPAGSVMEVIEVVDEQTKKRQITNIFFCKYMYNGSGILKVSRSTMTKRGVSEYSHYSFAYEDLLNDGSVSFSNDPYAIAIRNLHMSVIPASLPCRTVELNSLQNYLMSGLRDRKQLRPLYISGMPGTGKTATVTAAVNALKDLVKRKELEDFRFIEINCLMLKHPLDAYTALWRGLSGSHTSSKTALQNLNKYPHPSPAHHRHMQL